MFKSILFLYLVLSLAIDIHAAEMASFLDEDFRSAMLNDRPTTVGGVFNVFIRFADVTCDDSGECSEEDNRGALSAAVFASARMADDTSSELIEPDIWQATCYSFRLVDDLDAGEADAAGEAVHWRAAAHLRHIYDPTRRTVVSCASPEDLQSTLGWPAGFVPGRAADKRKPADEGGEDGFVGDAFELQASAPEETKSVTRETFGFEPIHTVAIVASYRATLAGGLPVVVMDVYWKIPVPTRLGFATVTQASQIDVFEQVLACDRGELPGCASAQKPLRLCPASSGCQHPFLFGGSTSTWAGLQPRPVFDRLAE